MKDVDVGLKVHHLTYLRGSLSQHGIFKDTVTRVFRKELFSQRQLRKSPIGTGQVIQATVLSLHREDY